MPIDRTETFVAEEGAGPSGELSVSENRIEALDELRSIICYVVRVFTAKTSDCLAEVCGIFELPVEVKSSTDVSRDDGLVLLCEQLLQQPARLDDRWIDQVLLKELRQLSIGIEHVAVLVLAVEFAPAQRVEHLDRLISV